jgi:hypothetical protein
MPETIEAAKQTPGPLDYVEGEMITSGGPRPACWLVDSDGIVIAAVATGDDFDRSKAALAHAATATQLLPNMLASFRLIAGMSIEKEGDAKWTWRDICLKCEEIARAAIEAARTT